MAKQTESEANNNNDNNNNIEHGLYFAPSEQANAVWDANTIILPLFYQLCYLRKKNVYKKRGIFEWNR